MKKRVFLFLIFFGCLQTQAQPTQPSAEAAALGGSFVTQHAVFSSRHNVAGLAFLEKNAIGAGMRNNYLANNLNDFYLLGAFKLGKGYLGFDVLNYGFDAYQQNEIGLSYATKIAANWSVGARLRYAHNSIPAESVSRFLVTGDVGILGKINSWRFGATVQNLLQSQWQGRVVEREPNILRIGGGYYFSGETAITAEFYKAENAPADVRFGFNYAPLPQLDLRFGFATLQPNVTFGLGILLSTFEINLAATWHQQLGLSPVTDAVYAW